MKHKTHCVPKVLGGTKQQETMRFRVENGSIKGLKLVKKVYKGIIGPFDEQVLMGDFEEGEHEFALAASDVPDSMFSRGNYKVETKFNDESGKCLWSCTTQFTIVKPTNPAGHIPCDCFA